MPRPSTAPPIPASSSTPTGSLLYKSNSFDRGLFALCKTTLPLGLLLWGGSVVGAICGCGRKILRSYRDRRLFLTEV